MGIANYITFTRILISPLFMLFYIYPTFFGIQEIQLPFVLLFLLSISELSDALDGYIARRFNQISEFGKIFDPMADSIARISVFLTFTHPPINLPLPLIFIFLYRDSITSTLRTICALRGFALAARTSGKIKAIVQAIASFIILFLMILHSMGSLSLTNLQSYSYWIVLAAALYALLSLLDYIYSNRHYIAKLAEQSSPTPSSPIPFNLPTAK
ncbi:MAG: CDP-alcohol phosphatidyltransferase family protein [Parachlamydiaceae bacterium]|nr:CDP-alcohol phosphatidyltransferase family protein [Parachlamydiaceae bacterium]